MVSVRAGNGLEDLSEIQLFELKEPEGWIVLPLTQSSAEKNQSEMCVARDAITNVEEIRAFHLQIALLGNHQNGRDTHVRCIRVFSPRAPIHNIPYSLCEIAPKTVDLLQFATIR